MHAVHSEGEYPAVLCSIRRAKDPDAGICFDSLKGQYRSVHLLFASAVPSRFFQISDCSLQGRRPSAAFTVPASNLWGRGHKRHPGGLPFLSSPRRSGREAWLPAVLFPIQHADSHGCHQLMAGKSEEISVQRLYVNGDVGARSGRRPPPQQLLPVGQFCNFPDRVHSAKTLEIWATATSLVRAVTACRIHSGVSVPSVSHSRNLNYVPLRFAAICHGRRLLWCSMILTRISSPGRSFDSA